MLTEDQKKWFGNRLDETQTGKVIVKKYLVKKYRQITGNYHDRDFVIKDEIIKNLYI